MPQSLSSRLRIDSTQLTDKGAFDPILDLDTRLFIDPHLLKHCNVPEFESSYENFQKQFVSIAKLLAASERPGDPFWRKADSMMQWPEVKGLCIGYSSRGTSGSGIGTELRQRLLTTAKAIIDKGRNDPELFELVGLFEEDFGSDRISDMTANVIRGDLAKFTARILSELEVKIDDFLETDDDSGLPINPYTGESLYLVPRSLLRDLPVALDWTNHDEVFRHNEDLRARLNAMSGATWREATHTRGKAELKKVVLEHPELMDDLIDLYAAKEARPYDFVSDRSGEYVWYPAAQKATTENPLEINLSEHPTIEDVETMVLAICERFRSLIENNGLSVLFYHSDGTLKHESAAQLLFYGVADAYCNANKIMIARETDSGRGPVDFKFGSNFENSVLVEVKKSTNTSGLKKGIEKQLPEYMKSERSRRAIYLVIDVGYSVAAIGRLNEINESINGSAIKIIHIDGSKKASASKL